jgi:hypothetical protein
MYIVGDAEAFSYGAPVGSSAFFHSNLRHASVAPAQGALRVVKLAYFFSVGTGGLRSER